MKSSKTLAISALFVFVLLFFSVHVFAQNSTNSSGGELSSSSGTVSYSVGQIAYQTMGDSTNGMVSEGVQQAFEIYTVSVKDESIPTSLHLKAYPNPTKEVLLLELASLPSNAQYRLYDQNGKLLKEAMISELTTELNVSSYVPGMYLLTVYVNQQETKTFKIIKN